MSTALFKSYQSRPTACSVSVLTQKENFGFALPSALWAKRVSKFELSFKYILSALYCFLFWFDLYLYLDLYYLLFYRVCLVNKDFQKDEQGTYNRSSKCLVEPGGCSWRS